MTLIFIISVLLIVCFVCNQTRNAISGTYSAPQRSASSAALLVGDPAITLDRAGNFVLPRADVMKLRDRLRNEEITAGSFFCGVKNCLMIGSPVDVDYRRNMCAHARILALEEAIDTEWVYMWDKFGGYLLLLLGLTAKAEQIQVCIWDYSHLIFFVLKICNNVANVCCFRMKFVLDFFWTA